jgi:hypothetical protein
MKTKSPSSRRCFTIEIALAVILWTVCSAPAQQEPQGPVLVTNAPVAGTFFLLGLNPPLPFPFDPYFGALPVYAYDGVFFVDDSQVADLSIQRESFGGGMMTSSLPGPGGGGGCTNCTFTNICSGPTNFTVIYQLSTTNTPPYGTNDLWLEMTVATNNVANLIIHTPTTNAYYDVFGTTNLSPHVLPLNQTNWIWLQRASGGPTNFLWTNITPCAAWFQLGTMQDDDGDGLTTAHEKLVTRTNPNMGDTDGDGLGDRDELLQSRNPLVGDNTSPIIHVVSPANSMTAQKIIQLDGYCVERLSHINYTIYTNGVVSDSGMGYVTNETYDRAAKQFTTNFFRCYDLPLAVGVNTIVLQAVDVNNNTNSLSVSYTVDFSIDTNAPTFTLLWPTNGMAVSGSSFTMNGVVDNPSASVKVTVASTNETNAFYGIVSGSGGSAFWVPDVTLPAGTSTVTTIMTSPSGSSSTSSVSLVKSTAVLTIQVGETAMNAFNRDEAGSASGEIPGTVASISVNGVAATTTYNSGLNKTSWSASDIPGNEDGWMELVATAVPSGGGAPITAKLEFEKLPLLRLKERHLDTTITAAGFPWEVPPHHEELHYKRKEGGYYSGTLWNDLGCTSTWEWTPSDVFTNYSKYCDDVLQNGTWYSAPPHTFDELTQEYQEVQDGDQFYTYSRSMKQKLELRAGGKPTAGRKDLVVFNVTALAQGYGFNNDVNPPFFRTNAGYVAASAIHLWGQTAAAYGNIYAQVVPGSKSPATPKFDVNNVVPTVNVAQHALVISANGRKLYNDIGTAQNNEFCVGESVTLTANWVPPLPDGTTNRVRWLIEPQYVNKIVPANAEVSPLYQIDLDLLTNATTSLWWYDLSDDKMVACKWTNTFPGGKMITGETKGWVSVYRPTLANFGYRSPRSFMILTRATPDQLSYGDSVTQENGMSWTNRIVSKYAGRYGVTQLFKGLYETGPLTVLDTLTIDAVDTGEWYDPEVPYVLAMPQFQIAQLEDYPSVEIQFQHAKINIVSARDFIRFKPGSSMNDGNIYVTLGVVEWAAAGEYDRVWGWLLNFTPPPDSPNTLIYDFPTWVKIVRSGRQ